MALAVCAGDAKFYKWPDMFLMSTHSVPWDCFGVSHLSCSCDGNSVLLIKGRGGPLVVKPPSKVEKHLCTEKCISMRIVNAGTFSNKSPNILALGTESGDVNVFDLETNDSARYKNVGYNIKVLDYSRDDECLLAGCDDDNILLFDSKGRPTSSFMVPKPQNLTTAVFSKYNNYLAGGGNHGIITVWNADTTDHIFSAKEGLGSITDMVFLENTVMSCCKLGFLCLFDLRTHKIASKCYLGGPLSSLAYFPGSYDLAVATEYQLQNHDFRNLGQPIKTLIVNGPSIKKIVAMPSDIKSINQEEPQKNKKCCKEDVSGCGDFSPTSDDVPPEIPANPNPSKYSQMPPKTYKQSDIKELETFIEEYMKHRSAQLSDKMSQIFYTMRINTSKQCISVGEKIEESWNNFIAYLKAAGISDRESSSDKLT